MNVYQKRKAISLFQEVGFALEPRALELLNEHFVNANDRLVMVMSHTCTDDFLLGLLLFGCSSIPITMYTRFRSALLNRVSEKLGMITHQEGVSNTQRIIDHLKQKSRFGLLIGLARTEENARVHEGYFHISQALQAPIIVLGFDYLRRTGYVSSNSWLPKKGINYKVFQDEEAEAQILGNLQLIYPQKPQLQVGFDVKKYPHLFLGTKGKRVFKPNTTQLYYMVVRERTPSLVRVIFALVLGFTLLLMLVWMLAFR